MMRTWSYIICAVCFAALAQAPCRAVAPPICLKAPFTNGEVWVPSTYPGHPPAERTAIDWNWQGGNDNGKPIRAAHSGTVQTISGNGTSGCSGTGYGNEIKITADENGHYATLYGHMSSFAVANGAHVNIGDTIGYCGQTGAACGTHLHFELRKDGVAQDISNLEIDGQSVSIDFSHVAYYVDGTPIYTGSPITSHNDGSSCGSGPCDVHYDDLWVQIGGPGSDCGTFNNPYKSLYTALANTANNGTITLKPGGAFGTGTLDPGGRTVTLQPQAGTTVTLGP